MVNVRFIRVRLRSIRLCNSYTAQHSSDMKILVGVLVGLLLMLQYRLWFGEGSIQEVSRLRNEAAAGRAELIRLNSRNQALAAEVADLKSGLDAIEERARADLGMISEGETFYQFVLEAGSQSDGRRILTSADGNVQDDEAPEVAPSTEGVD